MSSTINAHCIYALVVHACVTRFGEISPFWQEFLSLGPFYEALYRILQTFKPTLAFFILLGKFCLLYNAKK